MSLTNEIVGFLARHKRPNTETALDILHSHAPEKGHITTSAMIVNKTHHVLAIHHIKHNMWLLPGGHVDAGETPLQACIREVEEEVGIIVKPRIDQAFLDVDVHPIKDKAGHVHWHIDLRYDFEVTETGLDLAEREIAGAEWVSISELQTLQGGIYAPLASLWLEKKGRRSAPGFELI